MKTAIEVDLTYNQVLALVKQLPKQEKLMLTKELEKEVIESKLSKLLESFQTDDLRLDVIDEEVEIVRQQLYDRRKH